MKENLGREHKGTKRLATAAKEKQTCCSSGKTGPENTDKLHLSYLFKKERTRVQFRKFYLEF
jgi:hypothetical protein